NLYRRMMFLKTASLLCLIFLLMITGALESKWSVTYRQNNLCALKGSTAFMNGSYTHPTSLTVTKTFWLINPVEGTQETDLRNVSGYSGRVEYLGDEQKHFSLRLSDLKKTDEQEYYFKIRTNVDAERWMGKPGVTLNVTDLQLIAPAEVTEGQSAVLICKTTCSLTDPTFIWYKNSRDLTTNTIKSNEVHLQPVSSEDAGSYSCAVRGYEHLPSPAQTLSVRYSPKNVSVSISPSGEIVEGSSGTLTCSSDANPPVENYTWYMGSITVGEKKIYTINKISSENSGEYTCKCSNEVGHQNSSSVTLNVLYPPKSVSVSINSSGEIVENSSVTLTCSSDANPPVENYTWFKGTSHIRTGINYTITSISSEDSGNYTCQAVNKHGNQSSTAVSMNVLYPPKNVSVSISSFGEIVEDSSVTLTCSSDANPPVENYTWFKVNESSAVGSGQSYNLIFSSSSKHQYYCEAQNKHGSERSAAVSITLNGFQRVVVYVGVGIIVLVCVCLIFTFFFIRKMKRTGSQEDQSLKQGDFSTNMVTANPINPPTDSALNKQDEVLYASVECNNVTDYRNTSESSALKASVSEEEEVQYASVRYTRAGADY
ncbi:B-cell receptor CD22-like, partial [Clarias magur]